MLSWGPWRYASKWTIKAGNLMDTSMTWWVRAFLISTAARGLIPGVNGLLDYRSISIPRHRCLRHSTRGAAGLASAASKQADTHKDHQTIILERQNGRT